MRVGSGTDDTQSHDLLIAIPTFITKPHSKHYSTISMPGCVMT